MSVCQSGCQSKRDWSTQSLGVSATRRPRCLEYYSMRLLLDVGFVLQMGTIKSFDCRDLKKTCCSEALSECIGVDPNLVVLWNTDADECGKIFIRVRFSFQFYITLALGVSSAY